MRLHDKRLGTLKKILEKIGENSDDILARREGSDAIMHFYVKLGLYPALCLDHGSKMQLESTGLAVRQHKGAQNYTRTRSISHIPRLQQLR